jgi:hypothetical protein
MRIRLRQFSAIALIFCLAGGAAPAQAFDFHRHLFMTSSALDGQVEGVDGQIEGAALAAVLAGTIYPDISGCALYGYCDGWKLNLHRGCRGLASLEEPSAARFADLEKDHFDANAVRSSMWAANLRVARARAILLRVGASIDSDEERRLVSGALLIFTASRTSTRTPVMRSASVPKSRMVRGLICRSGTGERTGPVRDLPKMRKAVRSVRW